MKLDLFTSIAVTTVMSVFAIFVTIESAIFYGILMIIWSLTDKPENKKVKDKEEGNG